MIPDREIRTPGEGMLAPSTDPSPPADIGPNQRVRVIPPCPPWRAPLDIDPQTLRKDPPPQLDRRYWRVSQSFDDYPHGFLLAWHNEPGVPPPYGSGYGVDPLAEVSIFEVDPTRAESGLPDLWEAQGLFFVSTRLLEIMLDADAAAIAHKPILFRDASGEAFGVDHHLVDVVRSIKAVDYANSVIDYVGQIDPGRGPRSMRVTYYSSRIVEDLDPGLKLFRQKGLHGGGRSCFVADDLRRKIEAASPPIRNIAFYPVSDRF